MRVKQKIIETPAQKILKTSDTDTNSSNKVKLKNQKIVFPLRYGSDGLLLRELKPMLIDAARSSKKTRRFFKEECNGELGRIKRELKYRLDNNDSYREKMIELYVELSNSYFDAPIYMDGLIEKSFDEEIDDSKRKIILDMLMISGDGYSNLLDKILKNGEEDKRYNFCLEYLKALSDEAKKDIVLTAWCNEGNNKQTKNLAKSLSTTFGEDYIITTINEYVKESMGDVDDLKEDPGSVDDPAFYGNVSLMNEEEEEEDDYDYAYARSAAETSNQEENLQAFYNELENIADRQRLLLAILRNSEKSRTGELIALFNTAVSWKLIGDSVETAVKTAKGNKKQLSELFLEIAKNSSKNMEPAPVSYGLNAYAYLNKDKAPQVLKEIVQEQDEPIIAHNFVYSMLDLCGKEGQKAVKEIIKDDIKANRKSPVLFFLCGIVNVDSKENEVTQKVAEEGEIVQEDDQGIQEEKKRIACAARNILREIFSMDEDIAEFIKMNVEKKTGVVREFHEEWIMCELVLPKVRDITNCFDIKRLAEWMMYSKNPNLRDNTRNLLAKALYENEESQNKNEQQHQFIKKLEDFIQDGVKGKSKTAIDFVKRFAGSI